MDTEQRRPLVGLTPQFNLERKEIRIDGSYLEALEAAGAIPVMLPLHLGEEAVDQLLNRLDGVLFTGGPDPIPSLYGEVVMEECGQICPQRDELEIALARAAHRRKLPMMGICRGIQVINVALGGTLYQDIPAQVQSDVKILHYQSKWLSDAYPIHLVETEVNSMIRNVAKGPSLMVNSFHHQAVREPAPGLRVTARAEDGVIECLESAGEGFILAVEWHPELMFRRDRASLELFHLFTRSCRDYLS